MSTKLPPLLRTLEIVGFLEGTSALLLFLVAMPLTHLAHIREAVPIAGRVHGGLFLAYLAVLAVVLLRLRWPLRRGLWLFLAAIVPFGPFIADRWLHRWHALDQGTPPVLGDATVG